MENDIVNDNNVYNVKTWLQLFEHELQKTSFEVSTEYILILI